MTEQPTTPPLCDQPGCLYIAVAGTTRCLPHAEPGKGSGYAGVYTGSYAPPTDYPEPVTVPARPYGGSEGGDAPATPSLGEAGSSLGDQDAVECSCGDCCRTVPVADLIRTAPAGFVTPIAPPAEELAALADVGETTWHTARDGGLRAVRSGETLQAGDLSRHGTLRADGTVTPWPEDLACAADVADERPPAPPRPWWRRALDRLRRFR